MAGWVLLQGAHRCRARKCYKVEHLCSLCWVEMLFASSLARLVGLRVFSLRTYWERVPV